MLCVCDWSWYYGGKGKEKKMGYNKEGRCLECKKFPYTQVVFSPLPRYIYIYIY